MIRMLPGLIKALARGAWHAVIKPNLTSLLPVWKILIRSQRPAPDNLVKARLRYCAQCPFFNKTHQTCGTAGEDDGCWCFMPVKAMIPEATCWARDNYMEGWPDEINGQPQ